MRHGTTAVLLAVSATTLVVAATLLLLAWVKGRRRPTGRHHKPAGPPAPPRHYVGPGWAPFEVDPPEGYDQADEAAFHAAQDADPLDLDDVGDQEDDAGGLPENSSAAAQGPDWWAPLPLPGSLGALIPVTQLHPGDGFLENDWTLHVGAAGVDAGGGGSFVAVPVVEFGFPLNLPRSQVVRVVEVQS